MKNILLTLLCCISFMYTNAQAPQGIPYQSIIRNGNGNLLINQSVQVRFTIHDSTMSGNIVYQETNATTTSAAAMLILSIGQGTPVTGNFSTINWGNGAKFMQVELDTNGGNNYIDLGTQQMMSVPYALYAGNGLKNNLPVVITDSVFNNTTNAANIASHITDDGGGTILLKGVCWSTNPNPTISLNTRTNEGPFWNSYNSNITNLLPNTTYYVRSYSVNNVGISYGNEISFNTPSSPLAIGDNYGGGIIAYILLPGDPGYVAGETKGLIASPSDNGFVEWGCHSTFLGGTSTALGSGQANTTAIVNSCSANNIAARLCDDLILNGYSDWYLPSKDELYLLRENRNSIGGFNYGVYWSSSEDDLNNAWRLYFQPFFWGQDTKVLETAIRAVRSFSTNNSISITTNAVSSITASSAMCGGSIVSQGSATIISRGICWSTNPSPTISLSTKTIDGNGVGGFTSMMTGLNPGTTYHVRAYSTSNTGTVYGNEIIFSTSNLAIGVEYGGGKVAYIFQAGDAGYIVGEVHGFIVAQNDLGIATWSNSNNNGTLVGTSLPVGFGNANTNAIIGSYGAGTYAAQLCADLDLNGYSDWYLPSVLELQHISANNTIVGTFSGNFYWSSSEDVYTNPSNKAYAVSINTGTVGIYFKNEQLTVCAIRSF